MSALKHPLWQPRNGLFWVEMYIPQVLNGPSSFYCLSLSHTLLPTFFFSSLQADQRVLKDLMSEKLPRLTAHLEALKVDVSLITVEWFLVLFVESLPTRILFKVWDAFLYEGIKVPWIYDRAFWEMVYRSVLGSLELLNRLQTNNSLMFLNILH